MATAVPRVLFYRLEKYLDLNRRRLVQPMEKDRAKFILRSFRPDGADAGLLDFSEALALAAKDRDLGAWLARERSQDGEFANALQSLAVPRSLRKELVVAMDCTGKFGQRLERCSSAWWKLLWRMLSGNRHPCKTISGNTSAVGGANVTAVSKQPPLSNPNRTMP